MMMKKSDQKPLLNRKTRNHLIDFILITFCIGGALLQCFQATDEYMNYNTITIVEKELLEDEPMPAIGICISYSAAQYANHTAIQRLLQLPPLNEILIYCSVLDAETMQHVDCLSVSGVNEYIDSIFKCYSLFEQRSLFNGSHLRYAPALSQNVDLLLDLKVKAKEITALPAGLLVVYPNNELFTMKRGSHNKLWVSQAERYDFTFAMEIERHILLPAPFSTKCVDPALRGKYKTRAVALDKCILDHFVHNGVHYLPFEVYASTDDSYDTLSIKSIDAETERSLIQTALIECDKLLGEDDCFSETFKIVPVSGARSGITAESLRVQLAGLPLHALRSELKPSLSLLDYLNWIGSICNIWFAFTINGATFGIMDAIEFCMVYIYESNEIVSKAKVARPPSSVPNRLAKRNHKRLVKMATVGLFVVSFLFGMLQISDILEIHFSTPFKWNYYSRMADLIDFPTAVLCVNRAINETKVAEYYPSIYGQKNETTDWNDVLTIDQIERVTATSDELLVAATTKFTPRQTMKWGRVDEFFTYKKYVNYNNVCFRTFTAKDTKNESMVLLPYKRTILEQLQYFCFYFYAPEVSNLTSIAIIIQLDALFSRDGHLKLMQGNPYNFQMHVSKNQTLQPNRYVLYHREIALHYFAGHHKSECLPYKKMYGATREQLVDLCVKSQVMKSLRNDSKGVNYWPRELFFSKGLAVDVQRLLRDPILFSKDETQMRELEAICGAKFTWKDCEVRSIEVTAEVQNKIWKEEGKGLISFILYPPGKGYIEMRQEIRFSLLGLFGFCGGTIGFWIGISMLDIKPMMKFVRKIYITIKR